MVGQVGRGLSYLFDMNSWRIYDPAQATCSNVAIDYVSLHEVINGLSPKNGSPPYTSDIHDRTQYVLSQARRDSREALRYNHIGFIDWTSNRVRARRFLISHSLDISTIDKDFAVFFLQVEPESTVTPEAQPFCNQLDAISDFVSKAKSQDLVPLVKEHPDQYKTLYPFSSNSHWQNPGFSWVSRDIDFYKKVIEITGDSKCFIIDRLNSSVFNCMRLKIIGTLNGSVGIEAIQRNIKVYAYGHPWYSFHKGVVTPQSYSDAGSIKYDYLINTDGLKKQCFQSNIAMLASIVSSTT
jgi:hypothetical protein